MRCPPSKLSLALVLLAGTAAWGAEPVPLDVKTGQWEATVTKQMNGVPQSAQKMPAFPPEELAKLPPEQRAKFEALMKQASGAPATTTSKRCVTKDDLTKLNVNNERNPSCKMTLVSSSRTRQEIHMDCSDDPKRTGAILIEALNSESIKFNMQIAITKNGQPVNVTVNGTSKWLGATCTDAK